MIEPDHVCPVTRIDAYSALFEEFRSEGVIGKVVHVQSISQRHDELLKFGVPSLTLDGVFMPPSPGQSVLSTSPSLSLEGRLTGSSPAISYSRAGDQKLIDPAVVSQVWHACTRLTDTLSCATISLYINVSLPVRSRVMEA